MKKRTVKDFIALYAPEDEEKLVLIQDGVSADKTFLDTYWAAHTHALAMADVQTGQAISGRCYLSWPLTDKERDAGDYSKRFTKGQIYRIKARGWKGDALYEPQWYVTEVLEEGVPCPALEEIWAEYTKPILLEDEVLGTLTLDREMGTFDGTCKWMGKEVRISLDVEIERKASWTRVTNVMKKLVAEQEVWDKSLRAMAAQKLTAQANEWLADNDQTDRAPEKDPITEEEFARLERALRELPAARLSVGAAAGFTPFLADERPEAVLSPRDALLRPAETVPVGEAAGRIAARSVCPCPPGIAAAVPGERLSPALARMLEIAGFSQIVVLKTL